MLVTDDATLSAEELLDAWKEDLCNGTNRVKKFYVCPPSVSTQEYLKSIYDFESSSSKKNILIANPIEIYKIFSIIYNKFDSNPNLNAAETIAGDVKKTSDEINKLNSLYEQAKSTNDYSKVIIELQSKINSNETVE